MFPLTEWTVGPRWSDDAVQAVAIRRVLGDGVAMTRNIVTVSMMDDLAYPRSEVCTTISSSVALEKLGKVVMNGLWVEGKLKPASIKTPHSKIPFNGV